MPRGPALTKADVEVRLMKRLLRDRERAVLIRERVGFEVVERYVVPISGDAYGLAIWLEDRTGVPCQQIIDRLGAEVEELVDHG